MRPEPKLDETESPLLGSRQPECFMRPEPKLDETEGM